MNNNHLTDIEIQQYSFGPAHCKSSIVDHMKHCSACKAKANDYRAISSEIKNIQNPVFDFDLAGLVLPQLPQPVSKPSFSISAVYLLGFCLIALPGTVLFLLRPCVAKLFTGILPSFYYMGAVSAILITVFQGIEMYKRFHHKMARLNLY